MRLIVYFSIILVTFSVISGSVLESATGLLESNRNDPGEALYLTEYIENGDIETAQHLSLVNHPDMPIESYAGYFTVNKTYNSNTFFWYFPAKEDSENAPVILWLQGGPGASSLFGLFTENGPFMIPSADKFIANEYSWHLNHNLIYIDNPVGAGFSFTDSDDGYAKNQIDVGQNLLTAMQQFFLLFPTLQKNDFFVSGESYAGKYVPALAHAIYEDSKRETDDAMKPKLNLKGLAIGNGWSDPIHQTDFGDLWYHLGIIDSNEYEMVVQRQNEGIDCIKNSDFECAFDAYYDLIPVYFMNFTRYQTTFNILSTNGSINTEFITFLERSETRRAIHVGNNSLNFHTIYSKNVNLVLQNLKLEIMDSVADWVAESLSHYPILIFNGNLDLKIGQRGITNYLKSLKFDGAEEFKIAKRNIWHVDNEIAGYVKQAGNLTELVVLNSGHLVLTDQPKRALDMIWRFTRNKGFQ